MASEHPQRDAFIAAIEAKIAAWTAVLDSYKAAVSLDKPLGEVGGGTPGHPRQADAPVDLPVGVFRGKSIPDAIEIFLQASRRKRTNKEIAAGLRAGGIASTSANFEATLATALGRMREDGTVLRFPDGWDLAASYPESLRSRLQRDLKPTPKPASKGRAAKGFVSTKTAKALPRPKKATEKKGRDKTEAMRKFIEINPGSTVSDVVSFFAARGETVSRDYVRVVSRRLRDRGAILINDGKFSAAA